MSEYEGRNRCYLETQSCILLDGTQTDADVDWVYCETNDGVQQINCPGKKTI